MKRMRRRIEPYVTSLIYARRIKQSEIARLSYQRQNYQKMLFFVRRPFARDLRLNVLQDVGERSTVMLGC